MADSKISAAAALSGTGLVSTPAARAGSTTKYRRVDNLTATADPTINDDAANGFHVGSLWMRPGTGDVWQCSDATTGAAVWRRLTGPKSPIIGYFSQSTSFLTNEFAAATVNGTPQANRLHLVPIIVPYRRTFTKICFELTTVVAGTHTRLGLYNSDPANDYKPTTLVPGTDAAEFDTSATTGKRENTFSGVSLDAGFYWGALLSDGVPQYRFVGTGPMVGHAFDNNYARQLKSSTNVTYGALPTDVSATVFTIDGGFAPIIGIR